MPFRILDGLKTVEVTPDVWSEWHSRLNEKPADLTRTFDSHALVQCKTRVRITTMFTGGPDEPWLTFVTGWPGMAVYSSCLGHARIAHHDILHAMLDAGWRLHPDYDPNPPDKDNL